MLEILKEYNNLKDEIDAFYHTNEHDKDYLKLIDLEDVPQKLKNTLILIHSNYKSELREQKSFNYRLMRKMLDIEQLTALHIQNRFNKDERTAKKHKDRLDKVYKYVKTIAFVIFAGFICSFVFAWLDIDAFNSAATFIRDIVFSVTNSGQEIQHAPPPPYTPNPNPIE